MEKSTSRSRRSGNSPDKGTSTTAAATKADAAVGQAKQRIQDAAEAKTSSRASSLPPVQDTFVDERNDVLSVINELEDQLDRQQDIRESLERELTNSAEKLQNANTRIQELEWQGVTLQTRVDALEQTRQQAAALEEELNDANERGHRIKEQLTNTERERARLKHELKASNKQVDELWSVRKERDGLRTDYKTMSVKVEELERNQRELFEERGQLQAEVQELQATLDATAGERNQLQMTLRATEDRVRELAQTTESLNDKIDSLRGEKKNLQVQITHIERENARLVEQRQFYECEVTTLRNHLRTAEAALANVKKAFGEVRGALTETKTRARRRTIDTWPRIGTTLKTAISDTRQQVVASATTDADSVLPKDDILGLQDIAPPAETPDQIPAGTTGEASEDDTE